MRQSCSPSKYFLENPTWVLGVQTAVANHFACYSCCSNHHFKTKDEKLSQYSILLEHKTVLMHQHRFEQYWTVHYIIDTTTITTLRRSSSTKGATAVQEHFSNIFTKPTLIPEFLKIARKLNHSLNEHLCTDKRYSPSWQMILLQKWQTTSLSSCKLQAQQQSTPFFFFLILQAYCLQFPERTEAVIIPTWPSA